MNILSKDAILAADDLPRETVHVPEWGGDVYVRTMSGTDRDAFTPCTHTVSRGTILQEASEVYIDNQTGLPTNNVPEYLLRAGATDWLEWRFGVDYGVNAQDIESWRPHAAKSSSGGCDGCDGTDLSKL